MTWYLASTRCKLTRAPPDMSAHRTHEEQLEGGMLRTTANRRDDTVHIFIFIKTLFFNQINTVCAFYSLLGYITS